jgi:hypothetical protein
MRRETGGFLDDPDIRKAVETSNPAVAIVELIAVGFWGTPRYRVAHRPPHGAPARARPHRTTPPTAERQRALR